MGLFLFGFFFVFEIFFDSFNVVVFSVYFDIGQIWNQESDMCKISENLIQCDMSYSLMEFLYGIFYVKVIECE